MRRGFLLGLLSSLAVALLLGEALPFWRPARFSDVLVSHWPSAQYIHFALQTWGQIPLWNATILSGMPLAADPLSGIWYPPNWIAALFPSAPAFNLLFLTHMTWGAVGAWQLGRDMGIGRRGSLLAACGFALSPKLWGHVGLGHLSWVMATAWLPWTLMAARRAASSLALRRFALAGALTGLVFLIDPRWSVPLGLTVSAFVIYEIAHSHTGWMRIAGQATKGIGGMAAFGLGVAGLGLLPLLELLPRTTRVGLELTERSGIAMTYSGLIVPDLAGWPETQSYVGLWILAMALAALVGATPRKGFWAGMLIVCLLLSLGDLTPLYGIYGALVPGAGLARVPARFWSLASLPLALLAGHGLEHAVSRKLRSRARWGMRLVLMAMLGAGLINVLEGRTLAGSLTALWALTIGLLFFSVRWTHISSGSLTLLALSFAVIDMAAVNAITLELRALSRTEVPDELARGPGTARIYSPSYSVTAMQAAANGLQLAHGVNPLLLQDYWDFMAQAADFPAEQYSVTLPPFPGGDPSQPMEISIDSHRLDLLAVDTVVASDPIQLDGYRLVGQSDDSWIYGRTARTHRAWLIAEAGNRTAAAIDLWTPNRIVISAEGPGRLVLSEIMYPGWGVRVDGNSQAIQAWQGLLRSVALPEGHHRVEFTFRPVMFGLGAAISLGTAVALLALWRRN